MCVFAVCDDSIYNIIFFTADDPDSAVLLFNQVEMRAH